MQGKGRANRIDKHVANRLRERRVIMGMSHETLGKATNVTFQQIQKYERGTNRVGASRLYRLARVLDVPLDWFYIGLDRKPASNGNPTSIAALRLARKAEHLTPEQRRVVGLVIKNFREQARPSSRP